MILLDTQIVAWLAREPEKLSRFAHEAIHKARAEGAGLAISDKTLWELAMMFDRGRLKIHTTLREFLEATEQFCAVLPVNAAIAARSVRSTNYFRLIQPIELLRRLRLFTDCHW